MGTDIVLILTTIFLTMSVPLLYLAHILDKHAHSLNEQNQQITELKEKLKNKE